MNLRKYVLLAFVLLTSCQRVDKDDEERLSDLPAISDLEECRLDLHKEFLAMKARCDQRASVPLEAFTIREDRWAGHTVCTSAIQAGEIGLSICGHGALTIPAGIFSKDQGFNLMRPVVVD